MAFAGRVLAKSVIGGTISAATGGKFANGAASAAFSAVINEAAFGADYRDMNRDGDLGPERFTDEQKAQIKKEIQVAVDGAKDRFDNEGQALEYAQENLFQKVADVHDIEISFNVKNDGGRWWIKNPATSFANHESPGGRNTHTHQTDKFFSDEDIYNGQRIRTPSYLINDDGIWRFRGNDWRRDALIARDAGKPLPSIKNYFAKYGGDNAWGKVYFQ